MSKASLKSILTRSPEIGQRLQNVLLHEGLLFWLEDTEGLRLFGTQHCEHPSKYPVSAAGTVLGYVCSGADAAFLADWLSLWAGQEMEKKKLGAEVLHLYREINLIFNFSEQLASAVGAGAIAQLAIREAGSLIAFNQGAVVFQKGPDASPEILAQAGDLDFLSPEQLHPGSYYQQIIAGGSSEIVRLTPEEGNRAEEKWLMYATLKVKHRVSGAILLLRQDAAEFTAAELKLLTTLALQSAAAMESSLSYEKATTRALEMQREQLVIELALRDPFFRKVVAAIESRISDPGFGVEQLSRALYLSPSQLQRRIVALTDKTPLQIIRDMRLRKAKDLLRSSDLNIAEVAWQCGFGDPSYFTRIFTREVGVTPSAWKGEEDK